ncbi:MAG: Beta-galactosidase trimerization domain protein, partial [Armatimonadetes bacterium]|nr:Beta-galactosidase trimerization domain protein [Armatimonadota bacterium]
LVMSDNTRNFYGRSAGKVEERYLASVLGTFRTAVEEHLPVTVINDWNLTPADLARYKVLILPNTACLDDAQAAAVDQFVRNGGGLVASLDTSLFDEYGNPRKNFALGAALGVEYQGLPVTASGPVEVDVNFAQAIGPDYWEKRKSVFDFKQDPASLLNQGRMKTYVGDQPVTFKGAAVRVAVKDPAAKTLATLRAKDVADTPFMPGVVSRTHGKGRVVYFAAGLDSGYYLYAYPYQRLALRHAIDWAASAPAPVRADDVPLREETVPIHDIQVTFGPEYRLRKVHLEPGGKALAIRKTAQGSTVTVPRLEVHSMVVGELEGGRGTR